MQKSFIQSLPVQLLKLLVTLIISYLIVIMGFSIAVPSDPATGTIPEKYDIYIFISGLVLALAANFLIEYNQVQKLKYAISKTQADITATQDMKASLLDKAERVTDKYMRAEKELYSEFAQARKPAEKSRHIHSGSDFRGVVESYPEMKSNEHIQKLLSQLENSEAALLHAKKIYSDSVAKFNTKIHSFPMVLFRRICKWEDIQMDLKEDMVTDSELGI